MQKICAECDAIAKPQFVHGRQRNFHFCSEACKIAFLARVERKKDAAERKKAEAKIVNQELKAIKRAVANPKTPWRGQDAILSKK